MRLSITLSLYIVRQYLVALAGAALVILGVIMLFDLIELIRRAAGKDGIPFSTLGLMALLKMPQMTHTILPFAVMIGAMLAFWRLTRSHELVVVRSAGVSAWQFLAPVLMVTSLLGVAEVTLFTPLSASLFARFDRLQDEVLLGRANSLNISENGLWLREGNASEQMVVHADQVRQDGLVLELREVHLFLYEGEDHFARRLSAEKGRLIGGILELTNVWEMEVGRPSERLDELKLASELTLDRVRDNFTSPETLSFWQLPGFINFFEKAGFAATKHRMYWQSLLASPFLYCAMVLIAALFTLKPNNRAGGLLIRVGGGVGAGLTLYFFSKVVYALGLSSTIPQILAAWSPALVAGLAGVAGLLHLEDG